MPCAAHNIQLVLKDGLQLDEVMTKLIDKVSKEIVSKSKFSSYVAEELLKFRKKFAKRVVTRWNSILFMIRSVLKLTPVEFATIRSKMPKKTTQQKEARDKFNISDTERKMLEELKVVLEWFEWVTDELQSNDVSISKVLPCITFLQHKLTEVDFDIYTRQLRTDLMKSLSKRFGNFITDDACVISTFLDPNFGIESFPKNKRGEVEAKIKRLLDAFDSVKEQDGKKDHPVVAKRKANYIFFNDENDCSDEKQVLLDKNDQAIKEYGRICQGHNHECVLTFWKQYQSAFPGLSRLAKKYLGVQASSAAVERMFSISGFIFSERRRRLGAQFFENLVLLKLNEDLID